MKACSFAVVLALLCVCGLAVDADDAKKSQFGKPKLLTVGSEPLNADGKIMYPSPAIVDIDGDGRKELVLGSIFGGLFFSENQSEDPKQPQWSPPKPVLDAESKPIKLNNW